MAQQPQTSPLLPGQTLSRGQYTIQKMLGQGGFGYVYLATDARGQRYAIKQGLELSQDALMQLGQEVAVQRLLSHPNLAQLFETFSERPVPQLPEYVFVVMEYVEGQSLEHLLEERLRQGRGPLSESEVNGWMSQLLQVLEHAHRHKIIHRDIKPGNIMLLPDARTIKLIDFGIVKIGRTGMKTQRAALGVSPGFSPPEQYAKSGTTDAPSDLYAVGATMYWLLTGQMPAEATSIISGVEQLVDPRQHTPQLSPRVGSIILKAMSINMADRYQSAAEMLAALHGQNTPQTRPCPHCGKPIKMTARFCPACGKASTLPNGNVLVAPTTRAPQVDKQPGFVVVNGKEIRNVRQLVEWCDANWRDAVQLLRQGALADICQHFGKPAGGLFGRGSANEDGQTMLIKVQQANGLPDDNIALEMALRALGAKTPGCKHNWNEVESKLGMGLWPDPRWLAPWWEGPRVVHFTVENQGPRGYLHGRLEPLVHWLTVNTPHFGCFASHAIDVEIYVDKKNRKLKGLTPELFNLVIE
ncbi:MAG: protein kinase [Caldilineaceae bacterium]|nr:protein kinase [Caldilineaceae bacterium]